MAKLEVLANGAIYVNDSRITNRSTKPWGGSSTVFETKVDKRSVVRVLLKHGYNVNKINEEPFVAQRERLQ